MNLKRILIIVVLCVSCQSAYGKEIFPFVAEVNSNDVNVRSGQSVNFENLCQLNKGDKVIVVDKDFSWYKIELPKNADSYVSEQFVLMLNDNNGEIIGKRINVRSRPSTTSSVLRQVSDGVRVVIIDKKDGWFKIEPLKKSYGWIAEDFLVRKNIDIEKVKLTKKENITITLEEPPAKDIVKTELVRKSTEDNKVIKEVANKDTSVAKEEKVIKNKVKISKENKEPINFENIKIDFPLKGYVKYLDDKECKDIKFQLLTDDKKIYYLNGPKHILHEFLNFKVKIDGKKSPMQKNLMTKHPIVDISEIELIL